MRAIDALGEKEVREVQIYLTAKEAAAVVKKLNKLLADVEAAEHFHIADADHDLSFSIVTPAKLKSAGYTPLERQVLAGMCD